MCGPTTKFCVEKVFAGGIMSMGLGIFALADSNSLKDFIGVIDSDLDINLFAAGGIIVGASLVIAGIAFFGCCGAAKVSLSHYFTVSPLRPPCQSNVSLGRVFLQVFCRLVG